MIKNIQNGISRIEPVISGSTTSYYFRKVNNRENKNPQENNRDEFRKSNLTNPYFEENEKEINEIQLYFNEKYSFLSGYIKEILDKFAKNGEISEITDETALFAIAVVSKYLYDNSLPKSADKSYTLEKQGNKKVLKIENLFDGTIINTFFTNNQIEQIDISKDDYNYSLYYQKQNIIQRLIKSDDLRLKRYEKKIDNSVIECVEYSKQGLEEKYSEFMDGLKQKEMIFDITGYTMLKGNKKPSPSSFMVFDKQGNLTQKLNYAYLTPGEYREYNPTSKILSKTFKLQGIKCLVSKYAFYNSLNGNLIASGVVN